MTAPDSSESHKDGGLDAASSAEISAPAPVEEKAPISEKTRSIVNDYIAIADRFRDSGKWEDARSSYEQALELDPSLQPIWIQLGHARKESKDLTAAEAAYREATRLDSSDPEAFTQLGHLLKMRNVLGGALEAFTRVLALAPSHGEVRLEIELLKSIIGAQKAAARSTTSSSAIRYPRAGKPTDGKTLQIAFDVSDLMHYFRNARLPTGIQRVQIEVIRNAIEAAAPGISYSIVCFTKETDFWIEIPPLLFGLLCKQALVGGDHQAPEWLALMSDLDAVLAGRQYFSFARGSVLLNLGTSWWLQNYFLNVRLAKSLYGIKYVPFVHDFIPVMAPEHCVSELRQDFITWAIGAFDHADFFLVNSKATLADLHAVGKKLGYDPRNAAVVTLNADFRKTLDADAIADEIGDPVDFLRSMNLEKNKYVLFVSTIESRKNHLTAFSVWLKLIKKRGIRGVPKLVCVGNPGWLNDAAYSKLNASELLTDHVLMLSKIPDAALSALYENCICTLYPSSYEGWGLPVTEALCYGKVPIISNVSSLPEAGGTFAEYFEAESEKDLFDAVERVVYDDKFRARRELKIVAEFRPRGWDAISAQIVGQLRDWAKVSTAPTPTHERPDAYGIWPVEAETGILQTLTSNSSSTLWAGLKSGEIYRNGPGWWWPEHWGCWIKNMGPAQIAFVLEGVANSPILVYVGLRGVQGRPSVATVKCEEARTLTVPLGPEQDKVVSLVLAPSPDAERLVVISVSSDAMADFRLSTGGVDFRSCGVGVRWFYACREDDLLARVKMIEAVAMSDFVRLEKPAPEIDFFMHT